MLVSIWKGVRECGNPILEVKRFVPPTAIFMSVCAKSPCNIINKRERLRPIRMVNGLLFLHQSL